ncbi:hypothetical protein BS17DRAFT_97030 [Gyrodon lividus]|nr:hypothetical protein BS17DRAFT_97030 [Gyrodon lividus]
MRKRPGRTVSRVLLRGQRSVWERSLMRVCNMAWQSRTLVWEQELKTSLIEYHAYRKSADHQDASLRFIKVSGLVTTVGIFCDPEGGKSNHTRSRNQRFGSDQAGVVNVL